MPTYQCSFSRFVSIHSIIFQLGYSEDKAVVGAQVYNKSKEKAGFIAGKHIQKKGKWWFQHSKKDWVENETDFPPATDQSSKDKWWKICYVQMGRILFEDFDRILTQSIRPSMHLLKFPSCWERNHRWSDKQNSQINTGTTTIKQMDAQEFIRSIISGRVKLPFWMSKLESEWHYIRERRTRIYPPQMISHISQNDRKVFCQRLPHVLYRLQNDDTRGNFINYVKRWRCYALSARFVLLLMFNVRSKQIHKRS